jgi:hypothetical protein
MHQETFEAYGFGEMSQEETVATCEKIFADHLGGHSLMTNANHMRGSAWMNSRGCCARNGAMKRRADGRCRGDGAFLHRLGHQAGL